MLSPGERAISREQAFVLLDRLDQVEAKLADLRHGPRQLLAEVDNHSGSEPSRVRRRGGIMLHSADEG
jgi:hypothetical protein